MSTFSKIPNAQLLGQTEQHLKYLTERIAIHKNMVEDFNAMVAAAENSGITLHIASGFRSFKRQQTIWNNKFSGKTVIKDDNGKPVDITKLSELDKIHHIMLFSALPGASRHHWGCDIDVYAPNLLATDYQLQLEPWEYEQGGPLEKLSNWLSHNAHLYGFYLPYATYQGGVAREPWHLSYAPLSNLYQQSLNIEVLSQALIDSDVLGKACIIENLSAIMTRYINNVTEIPNNVIIER